MNQTLAPARSTDTVTWRSLTHPLALLAAATLLLNGLVFQRLWPSWWTGKIGDVAALALAPLLLAPLLRRLGLTAGRANGWATALVGLAFALVKAVPAANAWVVSALAALGYGVKLALDPTDLLALPGLALAWHIGRSTTVSARSPSRLVRAAGLALTLLALVADSAGAFNQGVECVGRSGANLVAVTYTTPAGYTGGYTVQVLTSSDGGLTWALDEVTEVAIRDLEKGPRTQCDIDPWPLADPNAADVFYTVVPDRGLYVTSDGGQTLTLDLEAAKLPEKSNSAVVDGATGNLVLAAGLAGVWVRTPDGEWQTVALPLGPGR